MSTPLPAAPSTAILDALAQWPFAVWLRSASYTYPVLETTHIVAIATLFGTILIVDWNILRRRYSEVISIHDWMKQLLPWTLAAFCLAALSGSLMFLARAGDMISNPAFVVKMTLLMVVGVNAAMLHTRGRVDPTNNLTRIQAAFSIALWLAIIACGRWIAYV
jgi:hypothetical protein